MSSPSPAGPAQRTARAVFGFFSRIVIALKEAHAEHVLLSTKGLLRIEAERHRLLDYIGPGNYGGAYFEQYTSEIKTLNPPNAALIEEIKNMQASYEKGMLTWSDLDSLGRRLLPLLPLERVDAIRCNNRTYYYQCARPAYIADYDRSSPPALNALSTASDQEAGVSSLLERAIRADAVRLHSEISHIEIYRPYQEEKRTIITKALYLWAFVWLAIYSGVGGLCVLFGSHFPVIAAVAAFGALGAAVSSQRRLQDSFDQDASILNITKYLPVPFSITLAPFNGSVFAIIFYLLLTSGLLPTDLLPHLGSSSPSPTPQTTISVEAFLNGPTGSVLEYAKLLVYSFLAGFAERLVPDTLDRLAGNKTP